MIAERGKGFRAGCPLPASFLGCSALQQLVGFDTKCLGQLPYDLQACVKGALLELAQIAPANLRFIGEIVLREPLLMAESAQVGGEHVSQIHARSGATPVQNVHLDILNKTPGCATMSCLRPHAM